ncbi:hypothetical protein, partial [Streptococcus suis]
LDYLFLKIYNIDNLIDLTSEKIDLELTISESKKNDINSQLQNTLGVLSLLLSTSPIYEFIVKPTIILLLDSINTLLVHFYKVKIQYRQYDNIITLFGFILTLLILYRILRNILPNLKSLIYNRKKRS